MEQEIISISLEPDWEGLTYWYAEALRTHSFVSQSREPIIAFIEQITYLALNNPTALEKILTRLKAGT